VDGRLENVSIPDGTIQFLPPLTAFCRATCAFSFGVYSDSRDVIGSDSCRILGLFEIGRHLPGIKTKLLDLGQSDF
jgi:hypothetical protein